MKKFNTLLAMLISLSALAQKNDSIPKRTKFYHFENYFFSCTPTFDIMKNKYHDGNVENGRTVTDTSILWKQVGMPLYLFAFDQHYGAEIDGNLLPNLKRAFSKASGKALYASLFNVYGYVFTYDERGIVFGLNLNLAQTYPIPLNFNSKSYAPTLYQTGNYGCVGGIIGYRFKIKESFFYFGRLVYGLSAMADGSGNKPYGEFKNLLALRVYKSLCINYEFNAYTFPTKIFDKSNITSHRFGISFDLDR